MLSKRATYVQKCTYRHALSSLFNIWGFFFLFGWLEGILDPTCAVCGNANRGKLKLVNKSQVVSAVASDWTKTFCPFRCVQCLLVELSSVLRYLKPI